nr:myb-like DNA-binding domain-containing protein [Colletotrichum truncatum]KAF6782054.1 myb-like DNA-binding domain-containing protein [Colletotrichum truncatum]
MFSSLSQRFFGTSPHKNSSPGPTRPPREEVDHKQFSSTAPAEMEESMLDDRASDMSQQWDQADHTDDNDESEDIPDGITEDYVDPFSDMMPFSTQAKGDEDDDIAAYGSDNDNSASDDNSPQKQEMPKKEKKVEEKETGRKKRKSKKKNADYEPSDQALPSPTTSERTSRSEREEANGDDASSSSERLEIKTEPGVAPTSNKKKRKRRSRPSDSVELEESSRKKKRKTRKPLEDIEDDEMEAQPQETIPDSPSNQLTVERELESPEFDQDLSMDATLKSEPQQSQLATVSRQLFQPTKGASATGLSISDDADHDTSDNDNEVSLSSPSVIAQRRRSMSRGSQISAFRQGVSRESTSLHDIISEAAESEEEASEKEDESGAAQQSPSAASQDDSEDEESQPDPVSELDGDVSMADTSNAPLASGALVDDGQSEQGDFADQLPPSSQPPREDTPSSDEAESDADDVDVEHVEQPQLPIKTFKDALNHGGSTSKSGNRKDAQAGTAATPGRKRQRNADLLVDMSEPSNVPSSVHKSGRSTASKRQRSKPNFFSNQDEEDQTGNLEADESLAAPSPPPSARVASAKAATTKQPKLKAPASTVKKTKTATSAASRVSKVAKSPAQKSSAQSSPRKSAQPLAQANPKVGSFDVEELKKLADIVGQYRDDHGLTQEEMNDLIHMKQRKKTKSEISKEVKNANFDHSQFKEMWDFITRAIPNRPRQKVINVARQEFHNHKKRGGDWTKEEEAKVAILHDKYDGSWVMIADEIGRLPSDVRDRYRNYIICGRTDERRKWTEEEERELIEAVTTSLRRMRKPLRSHLEKPTDLINWQTISEMMHRKRSRLQCLRKWKTLNVELNEADLLRRSADDEEVPWILHKARKQIQEMSPEDKYRFVESILAGAAGDEAAISWSKLVDVPFRRKWHKPTLKLLWHRLKQRVPNYQEKKVRDCARWILKDAKENGPRGAKFISDGLEEGDVETEYKAVAPRAELRKEDSKSKKNARSAEKIVDSDSSDEEEGNDETQLTNAEDSPSAQRQPSSAVSQQSTPRLGFTPSLQPPASQQEGSREPSPAKKRVRLSRGRSAKERVSEGNGDNEVEGEGEDSQNGTPSQSQLDIRKIPDRLQEKKMAARQRITSGSRSRSVTSLQPESVQNSDVDDDMPPIRVPASTQPSRTKAGKLMLRGNFARKTGSNVLPGEPVELTDEVMAELEAGGNGDEEGATESVAATPVPSARKAKRRRKDVEVAESPS